MKTELQSRARSYLTGRLSRDDLELWLVGNLQQILDGGDSDEIAAANTLDADLIELGEGLLSEDEFRERLGALLQLPESGAARST
jgi:hypothetical protein